MQRLEACCLRVPCIRRYLERAVARHFASSTDAGSSELMQISKAVEAIGLDASDLAQLIGDDGVDELPSVPPNGNDDALIYADGRVYRNDGRRLGTVRLAAGTRELEHCANQ